MLHVPRGVSLQAEFCNMMPALLTAHPLCGDALLGLNLGGLAAQVLALGWMQCWWLPCVFPECCCCWEMEPSFFSSCAGLLLLLLFGNHMSSGAGFQMAFSNWGSLSQPSVTCWCGAIKGSSGKHHLCGDSMDHM